MRLCDHEIEDCLNKNILTIAPRPLAEQISGVTVDLQLGHQFRVFQTHTVPFIDLSASKADLSATLNEVMSEEIEIPASKTFFLHPREFALAVTYESITLPNNLIGWLDGRSSLARLGLMIHATAHRIDPGWSGQIVLECYNTGKVPLALKPKMMIAALSFERLSSPVQKAYSQRKNAKYHDQRGAVGSRFNIEHVTD